MDSSEVAIWVQYAIVYQTAERGKMEVAAHPIRTRRTNRFLEKMTNLKLWETLIHTLKSQLTKSMVFD